MAKHLAVAALFGLSVLVARMAVGADESATIPAVGEKAPDFTLNDLDGQSVTLSKLSADSPVALVVLRGFPGYQCPICTFQVADLMKHADELADAKTQVVLVYPGPGENLDEKAGEFMKGRELPENFSYLIDPDYKFTNAYGLRWDAPRETAYPSTFVIDQEGIVRFAKVSKSHGGRTKAADVLGALDDAK